MTDYFAVVPCEITRLRAENEILRRENEMLRARAEEARRKAAAVTAAAPPPAKPSPVFRAIAASPRQPIGLRLPGDLP